MALIALVLFVLAIVTLFVALNSSGEKARFCSNSKRSLLTAHVLAERSLFTARLFAQLRDKLVEEMSACISDPDCRGGKLARIEERVRFGYCSAVCSCSRRVPAQDTRLRYRPYV